ncbi:hypothetical protein HDA32_003563 [Spinactinospora alkalitolerans]|uniref:Uncharacterized protein n=1 Tax=Spinactinospora alkalitolerans TaxID=687207 RepID=A0A852U0A8_9ACTN|nr:hypothetical protein [Spinactinospora alkalitolerans]NYE48443.1 hypothetical protein [Spinactinospora alkalitolerans]
MDLTGWLLRRARPRPFVVTAVGGTRTRLAAERELRRRAWRQALSPAEADVLLVCGPRDPELTEAVDRLWDQMPGPRARVRAVAREDVARALDQARGALLDAAAQRRDAAARLRPAHTREPAASAGSGDHGEHGGHGDSPDGAPDSPDEAPDADGHSGHENDAEQSDPRADHDRNGGDTGHGGQHEEHTGHGGHGGHGGGMEMPGGLPMADRGADRDGLALDRLHLALGPALPDWPAGLRVSLTVQGDVVQDAEAAVVGAVPADAPRFWSEPVPDEEDRPDRLRTDAAAALDSLQRLLAVAGWPDASTTARRLRDDLLDARPQDTWRGACARWARTVRRSRTLRWSTDGLGPIAQAGPAAVRGDATARWNRWLDAVDAASASRAADPRFPAPSDPGEGRGAQARAVLDLLPSLLVGRELAAVRLIVASLDPDLEALDAHRAEAGHG